MADNSQLNFSEKIILSINDKKHLDDEKRIKLSNEYQVKLNDWELGRNVLGINLEMEAGCRPELTLKLHLDEIELNDIDFETLKTICQK